MFCVCVELLYVLRSVRFFGPTLPSGVQRIVILNPMKSFAKNNNPRAHGKAQYLYIAVFSI